MLKERGRVKTVAGATDLSLTADADESFRVRGIRCCNPTLSYASLTVDKLLVGYYRVNQTYGNHLNFPIADFPFVNLWESLVQRGIFRPVPVAKGQTFKITGVAAATSVQAVIYDVFDPEDVKPNEPNGTLSNDYDMIQYGGYSTTLAAGENLLATQNTSSQYPAFPFGKAVPAKHRFSLRGLGFSDVAYTNGTDTNEQTTLAVKLVRNRETLFDEDRVGLPARAINLTSDGTSYGLGYGVMGMHSTIDQREVLFFDPSLEFSEGEDLDVYITTTVTKGSANITAAMAELALLFNVKRG